VAEGDLAGKIRAIKFKDLAGNSYPPLLQRFGGRTSVVSSILSHPIVIFHFHFNSIEFEFIAITAPLFNSKPNQ